jgi:putative hydrolase of the HAD superfamily
MEELGRKTKVVSFDVDGTLVDAEFNDLVWLEEIPRLHAEKEGISFEEAHRFVVGEYEKVGEKDLRWYDMNYWLRIFGIQKSFGEILRKYEERIKLYPDARNTLQELKGSFPMIVITLMPREFLEIKLKKLNGYFHATFSTISDFKGLKTSHVYREICLRLNIGVDELLHVGDSWEMDCVEPKKAGAKAFCVDRSGEREGDSVIGSLEELIPLLKRP